MADVVHRTTKQYLRSVHTPDYPSADWIINPDLSAVAGFAEKYWMIAGDTVALMDQAARDAVDAAEAAAAVTADKTEQKTRMDTDRLIKGVAVYFAKQLNAIDAGTFTTLTAQIVKAGIKAEVDAG